MSRGRLPPPFNVEPFVSDFFGRLEAVRSVVEAANWISLATTFSSLVSPVVLHGPPSPNTSSDGALERDTGRAVFAAEADLKLAFPAASDSNRDLSDAIDTGASLFST